MENVLRKISSFHVYGFDKFCRDEQFQFHFWNFYGKSFSVCRFSFPAFDAFGFFFPSFFDEVGDGDIDDGSLNACCFTWTKTCWSDNNKIHIRIQGNQSETYISMCNRGISKREMWIEQSDGKKQKKLGILHYGQLKCETKTSMYGKSEWESIKIQPETLFESQSV